ncbi:MAG: CofH family radical SAM protein [Cyanobacteria bacterium]|nr:CofH family radical SAM protein [Cyanobacteriota bacterium]
MAITAIKDDLKATYLSSRSNTLKKVYEKVLNRERLSRQDAIEVYHSNDLIAIGLLADTARVLQTPTDKQDYVYWVHNHHINPTNICEAHCKFCSFKKGPKSPFAYVMSVDDVIENVYKYPEHASLAEFHIVSGLYEKQGLSYYSDLFKALRKNFPHVHIKALTAVELDYISKLEGIPVEETIQVLKDSGLGSLPGGGAEVFAPRVRQEMCVDKIPAEEWLRIHGLAHKMGLQSNATLLAGLGETPEERIDHVLAIREQQDLTGGFMTFIPLNCYYDNNAVDASNALTGVENLKNFAISRLLLDNVPHIKSFWIHIGEKLSQVSLSFGVDDIDGTVVQEKIAHSAGTETSQVLTKKELLNLIHKAGKTPVERDTTYNIIKVYDTPESLGLPN